MVEMSPERMEAAEERARQQVINSTVNVDKRLALLYDLVENELLGRLQASPSYIAPYKVPLVPVPPLVCPGCCARFSFCPAALHPSSALCLGACPALCLLKDTPGSQKPCCCPADGGMQRCWAALPGAGPCRSEPCSK
jgi:hypothetical protein